jgi:hypothetical protein
MGCSCPSNVKEESINADRKRGDSANNGYITGEISAEELLKFKSKPAMAASEENCPNPDSDSLCGKMVVETLYCTGRIKANTTPKQNPTRIPTIQIRLLRINSLNKSMMSMLFA